MPQYLFQCKTCNIRLETFSPITADAKIPTCEKCKGGMVRVYAFGSVTFKGKGFYSTDK